MASSPKPALSPMAELGEDILLDVNLLIDYGGFVLRAIRRHKTGAAATVLLTFGALALLALVWPRSYQIDGRLLVQQTALVSTLVNPERALSRTETPTTAAQEIVLSQDNLVAMIKDTNLLEEWERTRPVMLRLKDRAFQLVFGPATELQRIEALGGLIEARLQVGTNEEGTVSFILRWPDPAMGRKLVDRAMQSFLEYRRVLETSAITDSIAILDKSIDSLEAQIAATAAQLPRPAAPAAPQPRPVSRAALMTGPSAEVTVRLGRLRSALDARLQEVARLDGARSQQLAEAQARLSAAQTIYTEGHPTVLALKQVVAQLAAEPTELVAARREVRTMEAEHDALSARVGAETESAERAKLLSQLSYSPAPIIDISRGETTDPVALRLKDQLTELANVRARGGAARAELASLQAGFKYQYRVVHPPQLPKKPLGPNFILLLLAGAIGSLMLAVAYAVLSDLASGRALEAWQVERQVGAPVHVRIPAL